MARRDTRQALPWLVPGLIALSVLAIFPLIYQAAMSLTDFNAISIRDGIRGGVWRAVWEGVTGQAEPVAVGIFESITRSKEVHWAGPEVLGQLLGGAAPDLLAFNLLWAALSVSLQAVLGWPLRCCSIAAAYAGVASGGRSSSCRGRSPSSSAR